MIRWEEEFGEYKDQHEWLGYLGKRIICSIDCTNFLTFPLSEEWKGYKSLSSAKRGAERALKRFLKDAGLEVRGEYGYKRRKNVKPGKSLL